MADMLVNLYADREFPKEDSLLEKGIHVKRALALDRKKICKFITDNFHEICTGWADECTSSLYRHPTGCFIATKEKRIIGFACYNGTAKGMVGPIGVAVQYRNFGIATVLLSNCLQAMKMEGYAYAIIGWVNSAEFYEKACGATIIAGNCSGIYSRMLSA